MEAGQRAWRGAGSVMSPDELTRAYERALSRTQAAAVRLDAAQEDVAQEKRVLERIATLFGDMTPEKVHALVSEVYAPDAYLNDSLKGVVGAPAIEAYFAGFVEDPRRELDFDFADTAVSREGRDDYVRWTMTRAGRPADPPPRLLGHGPRALRAHPRARLVDSTRPQPPVNLHGPGESPDADTVRGTGFALSSPEEESR